MMIKEGMFNFSIIVFYDIFLINYSYTLVYAIFLRTIHYCVGEWYSNHIDGKQDVTFSKKERQIVILYCTIPDTWCNIAQHAVAV